MKTKISYVVAIPATMNEKELSAAIGSSIANDSTSLCYCVDIKYNTVYDMGNIFYSACVVFGYHIN